MMIKRIAWFLGLKIAEFGGCGVGPYLIGKYLNAVGFNILATSKAGIIIETWFVGLVNIMVLVVSIALCLAFYEIMKANWKYAGKKAGKLW